MSKTNCVPVTAMTSKFNSDLNFYGVNHQDTNQQRNHSLNREYETEKRKKENMYDSEVRHNKSG